MNIVDFVMAIPLIYLTLLVLGIGITLAVMDKGFGAIVFILGSVYLYNKQTDVTMAMMLTTSIQWIVENWFFLVCSVVLYPLAGAFLARFKWNILTLADADNYREFKERFLRSNQVSSFDELDDDEMARFQESIKSNFGVYPRQLTMYKSTIISWIAFWPAYLLHYAFFDILRDIGLHVYRKMAGIFNNITTKNSQEYLRDMETLKNKRNLAD